MRSSVAQLNKKFPFFYGTKDSLPCSQDPATGPYHKHDEASRNYKAI
jgi:hypothetical protein